MYSLKKSDLTGDAPERESDYDLMSVIIIRRGEKSDVPVFDYLSGIFNCDREKISEYVNIEDNEAVWKGVNAMSGLGESIMMKAMQQGMQQGIQEGLQQGLLQGIQQGVAQGENLLATLISFLKRDGRLNELDRISDEEARKQLYREYKLID